MKWRLDAGQIEVVDDAVADILRKKTVTQRVAIALDANRTARMLVSAAVRRQHADWSDGQIAAEVARRMCGGAR